MKTIAINIKTDKVVKEQAQKLAEEMGLSLSAIVTASLKQFIRSGEIQLSVAPRMTSRLEKMIEEARLHYRQGKNISGPFNNVDDLMKSLRS
jgi:addiction module RelB/DinJ family antitoxin